MLVPQMLIDVWIGKASASRLDCGTQVCDSSWSGLPGEGRSWRWLLWHSNFLPAGIHNAICASLLGVIRLQTSSVFSHQSLPWELIAKVLKSKKLKPMSCFPTWWIGCQLNCNVSDCEVCACARSVAVKKQPWRACDSFLLDQWIGISFAWWETSASVLLCPIGERPDVISSELCFFVKKYVWWFEIDRGSHGPQQVWCVEFLVTLVVVITTDSLCDHHLELVVSQNQFTIAICRTLFCCFISGDLFVRRHVYRLLSTAMVCSSNPH